jgi:hypothetical protein
MNKMQAIKISIVKICRILSGKAVILDCNQNILIRFIG